MQDELIRIERRLWTNDAAVYEAVYSPGAVLIFPEVGRIGVEQALAAIREENAAGRRWASVEFSNVAVTRVATDGALLTYEAAARWDGEANVSKTLCATLYVQLQGAWRVTFHQQTDGHSPAIVAETTSERRKEDSPSEEAELQAQHEEIQAQQEQIQAQNEDLRQQAEQLRLHAAALREADERKNEFLGVLAHELRNPLAAIASSVFTLRRSGTGAGVVGRAQAVIQRQTRHLTRLIDDLLDITRVTHRKLRLAPEEVDLVELVRATVEDYRHAAAARGLTLDLRVPAAPVAVKVDPTRMSQVAGNLLDNSTKFTGTGGRITVSVERDGTEDTAVLRVADTGMGLSPSVLPHLFQAFRREPTGERRRDGGLGLGLALVKALVELHGGSVTARSEGVGRGAEFIVRVPALAGQTVIRTARPAAPPAAVPIPPLRILLVEDNVDVAASLRTALEYDGHVVETAACGEDALRRAAAAQPDVVLCDIGLPDIDGYEVARRVRADNRLRRVCLVALSGYVTDADRTSALDAGFEWHLAKPPDFEALNALFRTLAVQRGAGSVAAS